MAQPYYYFDEKVLKLLLGLPSDQEVATEFEKYQKEQADLEVVASFSFLLKLDLTKEQIKAYWDFREELEATFTAKYGALNLPEGTDLSEEQTADLNKFHQEQLAKFQEKYNTDQTFAAIHDATQTQEYKDYIFEVLNAHNQSYYDANAAKLSAETKQELNTYLTTIDQQQKSAQEEAHKETTAVAVNLYLLDQKAPATPTAAPSESPEMVADGSVVATNLQQSSATDPNQLPTPVSPLSELEQQESPETVSTSTPAPAAPELAVPEPVTQAETPSPAPPQPTGPVRPTAVYP